MYRSREYAAESVTIRKIIGESEGEEGIILRMSKSSLMKLREGGAPRFKARKRNHQKVKIGVKVISPLIRNKFRVPAII